MNETPERVQGETRPSLLVRLRDVGDSESWQTFVSVYMPLVYGYARNRGLQDADAADLSQEVLVEVARSIRGFEYAPEKGRFRGWLGTICRHRMSRYFALTVRQPASLPDDLGDDGSDSGWEESFNARLLQAALERVRPHFEPATWSAFTENWLNNRPSAEVADELRIPIEAVYVARSRVLKRLRAEVEELAADAPHF